MNTKILLNSLELEINRDKRSIMAIHPHAVELCRESIKTITELESRLKATEEDLKPMKEVLKWIIAPDRPIGSDAEMVYAIEATARKILKVQ